MEVNKIKEIFPNHYQMILDFPTTAVLKKLLNRNVKYVWVFEHVENINMWSPYRHSLFGENVNELEMLVEVRNMSMEYLVETSDFFKLIPKINQPITLYQIDEKPPSYVDLRRLNGKGKYDLLKKEVDYLFEIEIPYPSDYSPIVSPSEEFLKSIAINNDITNLP
ncbi:hypothetical protein WIW50_07750 [Flavobacteriaceae bacterium 3-367]|uniref:hypothetical protein n=1 Tax=Eudoraea algarum TaxID=3417568 RepID=UPI003278753D